MSGQVKFGGSGPLAPASSTDFNLPVGSSAVAATPSVDARPAGSVGHTGGYDAHTEFRSSFTGFAGASTHVRTVPTGHQAGSMAAEVFARARGDEGGSLRSDDPHAMGRRYGIDDSSWEPENAGQGYDLHDGFSKWVLGADARAGQGGRSDNPGTARSGERPVSQESSQQARNAQDDWAYESLCAPQQSRVWGDPLVSLSSGTPGLPARDGWDFSRDDEAH